MRGRGLILGLGYTAVGGLVDLFLDLGHYQRDGFLYLDIYFRAWGNLAGGVGIYGFGAFGSWRMSSWLLGQLGINAVFKDVGE